MTQGFTSSIPLPLSVIKGGTGVTTSTGTGSVMLNTSPKIITSILDTNGNTLLGITPTALAVNYIDIRNTATGGTPSFTSAGADADVNINVRSKGLGQVYISPGSTVGYAFQRLGAGATLFTNNQAVNRNVVWPDTDISQFLVQRVSSQTGAVATGTTLMPYDDTVPQNTEGNEYLSQAITPKSTANKLKITVNVFGTNSVASNLTVALFQDSTAGALACMAQRVGSGGIPQGMTFIHIMTAGTTSATTFKVRMGGDAAGTTTFNGTGGARLFGGVLASSIVIEEISP